ncbi:MAG: hypothetical protein PVF82_19265 [Gammaproteobacteria bacterium]|jgi:hypothetical protein
MISGAPYVFENLYIIGAQHQMAKLDFDVRSLINHLYFEVSDTWNNMLDFLYSPDTKPDADLWVEPKPGTNDEIQLKEEIREFVIQTDAQMKGLPRDDFMFGYPITEKPRQRGELRPCFLAMPTKDWLPLVQGTIKSAAEGFKCELSVDNAAPGDIMNRVWRDIRKSDVIIADVTDQNPNVFYEMGLAHALGKTIIMIKQKSSVAVPFDVSNHKYYEYDLNKLDELKAWLVSAFSSVPQRYNFDPPPV